VNPASVDSRKRRSGTAVIEFALVFALLWLILGGVFRIGYSIYLYQSLMAAVSGAARYASRVDFDDPDHAFIPAVKNMAVYGSPAGGTLPLVPGLEPSQISVTWAVDLKGVPSTISVAVTGYRANALFQTFTWNGKPSVTVRYAGSYKS
jgi:Flp pilus assembly protein TadG